MALASAPTAPRFEHRTDAGPVLGLGSSTPRLSWTVEQADPGWEQTAYEIEVVAERDARGLPRPAPGAGARAVAGATACAPASAPRSGCGSPTGRRLEPVERSGDRRGRVSSVPPTGRPGSSPRSASELKATSARSCPASRRSRRGPRARLYATAHGIYVPLDQRPPGRRHGPRPGLDVLPRTGCATTPTTSRDLIQRGRNVIEALLGNGWYRGRLGYTNDRALYGDRLALLAQLEVTTTTAPSTSWPRTAPGGRARARSWPTTSTTASRPICGSATVTAARRRSRCSTTDLTALVAPDGPPIRPTEVLPARRVWTSPSGATLVDFGQNAVGWVRLRVRGLPAGTEVAVRHAEVLEDGELAIRPAAHGEGHRHAGCCPAPRRRCSSRP